MPKRRTFGHFLASSEDKLVFVKKEDMFSKRRTYGKPNIGTVLLILEELRSVRSHARRIR